MQTMQADAYALHGTHLSSLNISDRKGLAKDTGYALVHGPLMEIRKNTRIGTTHLMAELLAWGTLHAHQEEYYHKTNLDMNCTSLGGLCIVSLFKHPMITCMSSFITEYQTPRKNQLDAK